MISAIVICFFETFLHFSSSKNPAASDIIRLSSFRKANAGVAS